MTTQDGSATEFIVGLLGKDPELEWKTAEIVEEGGGRWTEANVYQTLTRLLAKGQIKRTVADRSVWWSIQLSAARSHAATRPASGETPDPAGLPAAPRSNFGAPSARAARPTEQPHAEPPDATSKSEGSASSAILSLLAKFPDNELQVTNIWEETGRGWARQTVANTVERLVIAGRVVRVKDGKAVWYAIAR